ncbi:MAG: hypothetical protein FWH20_00920 [Oscillospiraceae bacterium]|nr:hypothetical protein [Oscillospiraceae bacterium]
MGAVQCTGVYVRAECGVASPPHRLFRLHSLDCKLISSRLNRFYLIK